MGAGERQEASTGQTVDASTGSTISTVAVTMDKINPKDCQVASPLVIQGFSNCLGLFQVIMAFLDQNPANQLIQKKSYSNDSMLIVHMVNLMFLMWAFMCVARE